MKMSMAKKKGKIKRIYTYKQMIVEERQATTSIVPIIKIITSISGIHFHNLIIQRVSSNECLFLNVFSISNKKWRGGYIYKK